MPCSRIELANSSSDASSKFFRGWCELGRIRSISISRRESASRSGSGVPNRALKPLPSAFLCAMDNLLCESDIAFGPLGFNVVEQNWLSMTWGFTQPDVARNDRGKKLLAEE